MSSDLELLLGLSRQLHRLVPPYRSQQVHRVAEEFAHEARKELDFLNEADAALRFGESLAQLVEAGGVSDHGRGLLSVAPSARHAASMSG